jgi:hypothetical protein
MTIIPYEDKYKNDIIAIVNNFYDEALKEYSGALSIDALNKAIEAYKDNSFLLIIDDKCEGIISGTIAQSPISEDKIYQEYIWYINEKHRRYGVLFLKRVMQMLKEQGYTQIIMACMHNSKTEKLFRLYERMGFKAFETHFLMQL